MKSCPNKSIIGQMVGMPLMLHSEANLGNDSGFAWIWLKCG